MRVQDTYDNVDESLARYHYSDEEFDGMMAVSGFCIHSSERNAHKIGTASCRDLPAYWLRSLPSLVEALDFRVNATGARGRPFGSTLLLDLESLK